VDGAIHRAAGPLRHPFDLAANVAVTASAQAAVAHPGIEEILFCCFSPTDRAVYEALLR
jgi:O-acetyl-ADP-ribose deacetylase (regulator of RNase III)